MLRKIILLSIPASVLGANFYSLNTTIPWEPKNSTSNDQAVINKGIGYVADRTNAVIHVIDIAAGKKIANITGFAGAVATNGKTNTSISGPDGVLVLADRNELWVGDAAGTVHVVDIGTNKIIANVTTGGAFRGDEMAYDPKLGLVALTQPNDKPPYVAIISAANRTNVKNVTFANATAGLEQPAYGSDGNFYISVPATKANPGGEIAVIDPSTFAITKSIPVPSCIPAGIIFGAFPKLFIGCSADQEKSFNLDYSLVMDVSTGKVLGNITGVDGVDQVAYGNSTKFFFAAAYQDMNGTKPTPQLGVINSTDYTIAQSIVTDNTTAHAVAVDEQTNRILVPQANGIAIYAYFPAGNGTATSSSPSSASGGTSSSSGSASASKSASATKSASGSAASSTATSSATRNTVGAALSLLLGFFVIVF